MIQQLKDIGTTSKKRYICWCTTIQIKEKLENYTYVDEQQLDKEKKTTK